MLILTIDDLTQIAFMKDHPQKGYYMGPLRRTAQMVDKIIAILEDTPKDIIEYFR